MVVNYLITASLVINCGLSTLTLTNFTQKQYSCDINGQTVGEFNGRNVSEKTGQLLRYNHNYRLNYNTIDIHCKPKYNSNCSRIYSRNHNSVDNEQNDRLIPFGYRHCNLNFDIRKHRYNSHTTNDNDKCDGKEGLKCGNRIEWTPKPVMKSMATNTTDNSYDDYVDHCKRGLESVKTVVNTIAVMFAIIIAAYLFCVFDHPLIINMYVNAFIF